MAASGSKLAIFASIAANLLIAIMKFIASAFTGSAAMFSEGIHSIIDTSNGLLLLFGIKKSKQAPDKLHPFGHGKEVYFWSFIVAIFIFSLGGGVAIYEGIHNLMDPGTHDSSLKAMYWNYGVIIGAIIFEGASLIVSWKEFRKVYPKGFKSALVESKDAATLAVIIENGAAVVGLVIALIGVTLANIYHNSMFDALASIAIGVLLIFVALFMAKETKDLLIGETVLQEDIDKIKAILDSYDELEMYGNIRSMHLGPDDAIVALEVNFKDDTPVKEVERIVAEIKKRIHESDYIFTHTYVESTNISKSIFN
jgi:cation diffusion facilitator family transporter